MASSRWLLLTLPLALPLSAKEQDNLWQVGGQWQLDSNQAGVKADASATSGSPMSEKPWSA